ncbi:hypothetical protein HMPREF1982_00445 [Clostridiales bacterium oral taxon 876 str. F0540]|nr:hypothetical protein HMPREF1982_00445 [Clostridiales bacterium oral taxon 876 str. F0540]
MIAVNIYIFKNFYRLIYKYTNDKVDIACCKICRAMWKIIYKYINYFPCKALRTIKQSLAVTLIRDFIKGGTYDKGSHSS